MSEKEAPAREIYVCNNIDCKNRGADRVIEALRLEFAADGAAAVRIHPYLCFSACNTGPNLIIPHRRIWLSSVSTDDTAAVKAVEGGEAAPLHLQAKNDPGLEALILGLVDAGLICPSEDA